MINKRSEIDPVISVIIPTYREWPILKKCLKSLEEQTFPASDIEILVINNDPNSPPPPDFRDGEQVKILTQPLPGSYASRNLGVKVSKGQILAFTDSDCILDPYWIKNAIRYLQEGADLVGGKMEFFKEEGGDELVFLYEKQFSFNQKRNVQVNKQSITANLFVKKEVFEQIGYFPENLLSGGDFEWTKKASHFGYNLVFGEDVLVKHPARKSIASLQKKKKRTSGGMYFKFFKDYSLLRKITFTLHLLRPPVTILFFKDYTIGQRIRLFLLRWNLEWVGVKELFKLSFSGKKAERV